MCYEIYIIIIIEKVLFYYLFILFWFRYRGKGMIQKCLNEWLTYEYFIFVLCMELFLIEFYGFWIEWNWIEVYMWKGDNLMMGNYVTYVLRNKVVVEELYFGDQKNSTSIWKVKNRLICYISIK